MTTILEAIRNLETARDRGEVDEAEYQQLRASMMDLVEDAQVFDPEDPGAWEPEDCEAEAEADAAFDTRSDAELDLDAESASTADAAPEGMSEITQIAILTALGFATCMGLATWAFGDLMAAFTVSLGLFTAATIWVAHKYDLIDAPFDELVARVRSGAAEPELDGDGGVIELDPEAPERLETRI